MALIGNESIFQPHGSTYYLTSMTCCGGSTTYKSQHALWGDASRMKFSLIDEFLTLEEGR